MRRCFIFFICLLLLGVQAFNPENVCVSQPSGSEAPEVSKGSQTGGQNLPSSGLTVYRISDKNNNPEDKVIEMQLPDSREWISLREGEAIPEDATVYTGQGDTILRDKSDNFYKVPSFTKVDVGKNQQLRYKIDKKELESSSPK